jgi:tRNA G26 N,N-dimethylase Trm1
MKCTQCDLENKLYNPYYHSTLADRSRHQKIYDTLRTAHHPKGQTAVERINQKIKKINAEQKLDIPLAPN